MGNNCDVLAPSLQKNNPNDKIGKTITIPNACSLAGSAKNKLNKYIPNNGEYEWAGEGSGCTYSSRSSDREMTCNSGCTNGHCAIWGKKGKYKRTSYKANTKDCCLGKSSSNGTITIEKNKKKINLTCHPDALNITSIKCAPYVKELCSGNTIFNNKVCINYCGQDKNAEHCTTEKKKICNAQNAIKNNM